MSICYEYSTDFMSIFINILQISWHEYFYGFHDIIMTQGSWGAASSNSTDGKDNEVSGDDVTGIIM